MKVDSEDGGPRQCPGIPNSDGSTRDAGWFSHQPQHDASNRRFARQFSGPWDRQQAMIHGVVWVECTRSCEQIQQFRPPPTRRGVEGDGRADGLAGGNKKTERLLVLRLWSLEHTVTRYWEIHTLSRELERGDWTRT